MLKTRQLLHVRAQPEHHPRRQKYPKSLKSHSVQMTRVRSGAKTGDLPGSREIAARGGDAVTGAVTVQLHAHAVMCHTVLGSPPWHLPGLQAQEPVDEIPC